MENYQNMFDLHGKKALVVGAGGIGCAIASGLMQSGADIALAGRSTEKMQEFEQDAKHCGCAFLGLAVDVLDVHSIDTMVQQVAKAFGRIDILVNAVGMNALKKAEEYDEDTWDKVMDVNVKGMHLVTKAVGNIMIAQQYGRILNISSVRSILGMQQDYLAYCTSKGATNMYTKQIACEWAKHHITCNAIAPTFTRTAINALQLDDPAFYKRLTERIPLGRICTLRDLAAAAIYLTSDAAAFVTGQILGVDGGITIVQ